MKSICSTDNRLPMPIHWLSTVGMSSFSPLWRVPLNDIQFPVMLSQIGVLMEEISPQSNNIKTTRLDSTSTRLDTEVDRKSFTYHLPLKCLAGIRHLLIRPVANPAVIRRYRCGFEPSTSSSSSSSSSQSLMTCTDRW